MNPGSSTKSALLTIIHTFVCRLLILPLTAGILNKAQAADAEPPRIGLEQARRVLFAPLPDPKVEAGCQEGEEQARVICLITARFASDAKAAKMAVELFEKTGILAGLLPEQDFDGGYRGIIHLVPQLPLNAARKHLQFASTSLQEINDFFATIAREAKAPIRYRVKALELRFFRSITKRTPAAFANGWTVSYNTNGTLNHSIPVVRDLIFHEIFHLNDFDHGNWSRSALQKIYKTIVARCGTDKTCLAPYAPGWVKVVGGTYYAFMPGNDVAEYAAEIGQQYLREQQTIINKGQVKHPFKCGPAQNALAWDLVINEFFGGVDLVPACKARGNK